MDFDKDDLDAVLALLVQHRDKMLPPPPKRRGRPRDAWSDAISSWAEECDQHDDLVERFSNFVAVLKAKNG